MTEFTGMPLFSPKFRAGRVRRAWAETEPVPPPEEYTPPAPEYAVGLDLGQARDYSALCVAERTVPTKGRPEYAVRHLYRWPLGTSYTKIVADVSDLVTSAPLANPLLAVDQTGVGRAVVEMFQGAKARQHPVVITGGQASSRGPDLSWHVAKLQLVSILQSLLSSGRLAVAAELPLAATLKDEMLNFKVKVSLAGNESFEAWRERDHDDLVLAVALACWVGECAPRGRLEIWV